MNARAGRREAGLRRGRLGGRFRGFPRAGDRPRRRRAGHNRGLLTRICRELPCRVGGGLRAWMARRACRRRRGSDPRSAFFSGSGSTNFAEDRPRARTGASGGRRGRQAGPGGRAGVAGHRANDAGQAVAIRALCGGFLYTHVGEGLMGGIDMDAVARSSRHAPIPQPAASNLGRVQALGRWASTRSSAWRFTGVMARRRREERPLKDPHAQSRSSVLYWPSFRFETRRRRHASWYAAPVHIKAAGCSTRSLLCV